MFHFELPGAFRDPIFRPSRQVHVAFDREVYAAVRGQDLGTVRGQPIRPVLCGFGEPFTDWVFQTAMSTRAGESAFALAAPEGWGRGAGWVWVYALRWMGRARRLNAPDSLVVVFVGPGGEAEVLTAKDAAVLVKAGDGAAPGGNAGQAEGEGVTRKCAQQVLRDVVNARGGQARGAAGLALLMVARIGE